MDEKESKEIEKNLNEIIQLCLWGGGSDPLWENLMSAKYAYESLKILGLKIKDKDSVIDVLSGDNIDNANYLED